MGLIKNWAWVILTVLFFGVVIALIPRGFYDLGGDSATYIILGESLARGSGFHMVNFPSEPFCFYYPPVFPLILSLLITFCGRNLFLMHMAVALLGYAGLLVFYFLFKRYADEKIAFLSVVLLAVNPAVAEYSAGYILSDIPYLFFSGITLLAAGYYIKTEKNFFSRPGFLLICGLSLAYLSRYAGITLFFGVLAALFFLEAKVRFKKISFLVGGFILVFSSWQIFKSGHSYEFAGHMKQVFLVDPYAPYKGDLFKFPLYFVFRFVDGVNYYYYLLPQALFFIIPYKIGGVLREVLAALIFSLTFFGFWLKFKEDKKCVFHFYFVFYFLLIVFWPFREGVRFLLAILPLIIYYVLCAAEFCTGLIPAFKNRGSKAADEVGIPPQRGRASGTPGFSPGGSILKRASRCSFYAFAGMFFLASGAGLVGVKKYQMVTYDSLPGALKDYVSAHEWVNGHIFDEGVFLSRKPALTYFYTRHKAVDFPYTFDAGEIWLKIKENNVKYIIVDGFFVQTRDYLGSFIFQYKDRLELIYRLRDAGIFKIRDEK